MSKVTTLENRIAAAEKAKAEYETEKAKLIASSGHRSSNGVSSANSDERKCLQAFNCRDVKSLIEVNTASPRFKGVPEYYKSMVISLKQDVDISRLIQQTVHGEKLDGKDPAAVKGLLTGNYYGKEVLAPRLKAFGSTVVGEGDEWVPTLISSQYIEEFELDRMVASRFRQITMPSSPFDVPVQTNVTFARKQPESCDPADNIPSNNFGTSKITLEAEKLVEFMCLPEELNEDSAPQILSLARSEVVEAQARAIETAILNGDTAVTHQDTDVTAANDARKCWDGLRKLALANSANGSIVDFLGAAATLGKFRDMRRALGKFGVSVKDLVWILGPDTYNQMLGLNEVTTVDNFGPQATILQGALAALDGIPILISEFQREDTNALGVNTAPSDSFKTITLVNHKRFMWGQRRAMQVRAVTDPTPPGDRWLLASWWRGDFQGHAQSATEVSVVQGINIL